ncbi:hypothetical protein DH2020_029106 [Rehmannia glutinosa]|uniref:Uncharacterized protein n=1 Tax=Rehmannia glutinosa TaxID=99300 RepID=A0ABR0VQB6_REHGL
MDLVFQWIANFLFTYPVLGARRGQLNAHTRKLRSFEKLAGDRLRKWRNLETGEHALSILQRLILPHLWRTSTKSTLYRGSSIAHLTCMPTLSVMKMNILTMGVQLSMEKENELSYKQEHMRVSKTKFLLARRNGMRLFAWRLRSLVIRVCGESDEEEEVDQSIATRRSTLGCLTLLEEPMPKKRGLSSHYSGKSKSFGNLTDLASGDSIKLGKKKHR